MCPECVYIERYDYLKFGHTIVNILIIKTYL